jgi:hypothetical protein
VFTLCGIAFDSAPFQALVPSAFVPDVNTLAKVHAAHVVQRDVNVLGGGNANANAGAIAIVIAIAIAIALSSEELITHPPARDPHSCVEAFVFDDAAE